MSRNSTGSSKKKGKNEGLDKPFKSSVLQKAKRLAGQYRVTLERSEKLGYIGSSVELPTVFADGRTPDACYNATEDALTVAVATMIECGQMPPQPVSARKRTEQVNVRLTAQEKLVLSNAASSLGFKGLSDFMRNIAMNRAIST